MLLFQSFFFAVQATVHPQQVNYAQEYLQKANTSTESHQQEVQYPKERC